MKIVKYKNCAEVLEIDTKGRQFFHEIRGSCQCCIALTSMELNTRHIPDYLLCLNFSV